jgi:hypothetical protein
MKIRGYFLKLKRHALVLGLRLVGVAVRIVPAVPIVNLEICNFEGLWF